ncbi:MAG: DUF421 domain-containing protein [Clostridia bacterium]|nr:DUF421 domain-containing protein [Clostridia bacterium]
MYLLNLTTTLIIGLLALLFSTAVLGKTQINQATPFHFISALVLGELLGNAVYDEKVTIFVVLYTILTWTILMYIIELVTQKSRRSRVFFEGKSSIVIRNGHIDYSELKKNRMDIDELLSLLREKCIFSVRKVEYAILESNGTISVLKKWEYDQPTNNDLNTAAKKAYLPFSIISDGEIIKENLGELGFDEKWLKNQLKSHGIENINEVCYAEWLEDEGLHISKKS